MNKRAAAFGGRFPLPFADDFGYTLAMADDAKPRWFHLTPDRCVLGLLAVEGLLWLSERFHWFAFNQHKGWTVLIVIASVGAALLLMFLWFLAALLFRLRFQFSMLSLMLLLPVVVAVPFAWLGTEMKQARKQGEVVEWIGRRGGSDLLDYEYVQCKSDPFPPDYLRTKIPMRAYMFLLRDARPEPLWLHRLLGEDFFANVADVDFSRGPCTISDAGFERLEALTKLQQLDLRNTGITDAGLRHIEGLTTLERLSLGGTAVSDAGLEPLRGLTQLRGLDLRGTGVTDKGVDGPSSRHCPTVRSFTDMADAPRPCWYRFAADRCAVAGRLTASGPRGRRSGKA